MRVRVKLMRRHGIRLSGRDIANSQAHEGELIAGYLKACFFASLTHPQSTVAPAVLPDLYGATLIGLGNNTLVLQGIGIAS